jgi:hypothetical protein
MLYAGEQSSAIEIIAANLPQSPINPPIINSYSVTTVTLTVDTLTGA